MNPKTIHVGNTILHNSPKAVQGEIVTIASEQYYKISNCDSMTPFFMNIVSNSDLWMFISSNGALTAGRQNPDNALFPYYTDDRIYDSPETTGSKTIVFVSIGEKFYLWEPFSLKYDGIYQIERNIYKNIVGNKVIFEELNQDLNISFQYTWLNCDRLGFVRRSCIINHRSDPVTIKILDGIQNILPSGVERKFQLEYSTLADGYKKNELQADTGLAAYMLSSIPTDKAEPNESLRANTVWSNGLENATILLSSLQLDGFRRGDSIEQETDIRATRGAYFLCSEFELADSQEKEWLIVADVNKDQSDFHALSQYIYSNDNSLKQIENEILKDSEGLTTKIAQADGFQLTSDSLNMFRHCSNTLFNIMRGGIFNNGYVIDKNDFYLFIQTANKILANKYHAHITELPTQFTLHDLKDRIFDPEPEFEKLYHEYLPLTFSRRHGDPSRPWNQFSIDIKDEEGNKRLNYQGNWRDIFQNWEALALSFPEYINHMIAKFVNASTADGYNPYRVTRDGFDWEVLDPADPWSYIGYWGDHQIIYLLKLLELSEKYHPGNLQSALTNRIFAYAHVPYKIKSYQDIIQDPHNTIDFDFNLDVEIQKRVQNIGTDGKFILDEKGEIYHVNLIEKLILPFLVKLSNFIPEAGIWMNTQRPEWNDANNALVGNGASMVTLYYMRRYVVFFIGFYSDTTLEQFDISEEVSELFVRIMDGLNRYQDLLNDVISDKDRKKILDHLGQAGSDFRMKIYEKGFNGKQQSVSVQTLLAFFQVALNFIDHSIKANRRDDDLYHSYNLITISSLKEISIRPLYKMLEGQVAILSSGFLSDEESIILLNSLRKSSLYREDQASYLLYPDRELPRFNEKNNIPKEMLKKSKVLTSLIEQGDENIVQKDVSNNFHFKSDFRNARILKQTLIELKKLNKELDEKEIDLILHIYESVFDHQSFTGRSGTFYKYEGLGSIYWHMVSKLRLAVQDTFFRALDSNANQSVLERLRSEYYEILAGIGSHKNPQLYGAFPTDAYSHTPKNSGAQQPGMTGQVKEDIISRFGELGVRIQDGKIRFCSALLDAGEFLKKSTVYSYYDVTNNPKTLMLNQDMLAFTICQVPIIYTRGEIEKIIITNKNDVKEEINGLEMGEELSKSIFNRDDRIKKVQVLIDI
jgi:hypothetical protein